MLVFNLLLYYFLALLLHQSLHPLFRPVVDLQIVSHRIMLLLVLVLKYPKSVLHYINFQIITNYPPEECLFFAKVESEELSI
jgi:hypothetical protein